jgi:L-lactate utilization protein LutC
MIDEAIRRIGAITRMMERVPYPRELSIPPTDGGLAQLFSSRLDQLRAPGDGAPSVIAVEDSKEAGTCLRELCRDVKSDEILWESAEPDISRGKKDVLVGITSAGAIIASTGSVMIPLPEPVSAWPSLLVDRHYVVASLDQLVSDLQSYYEALSRRLAAGEALPNYVSITGCSRTADIEKMLIVPAHGPRQLRVILSRRRLDWSGLQRSFCGN